MRFGPDKLSVLGKVPWRDEYVRIGIHGDSLARFDAWLTDNVEWASAHAGNGWPEAYRHGGIQAFAFRPSGDAKDMVAGAVGPSMDSAGRSFPLAVMSSVSQADVSGAPEVLPLLLEEFWRAASQLVVELCIGSPLELTERLDSIRVESTLDPAGARSCYDEWVRSLTVSELASLIYGPDGAVAISGAIRLIAEAVRPCRGVDQPATPLTLRLPLGMAGGASVCFWIDLVKHAIRWKATIPSFFWSHDGQAGTMLLHLGDAPRSTVAELWMPTDTRDEFCDLSGPIRLKEVQSLRELAPGLAALCDSSEHTVRDLLQAIGTEL